MKYFRLMSLLFILPLTRLCSLEAWSEGIDARQANAAFLSTPQQLQAVGSALMQMQNSMQDGLRRAAADHRLMQKVNRQLQQNCTPAQLAPLYLRQIAAFHAAGKSLATIQNVNTQSVADAQFDGGISGRVTVEGQIPNADEIMVYAFNRFGYYAGSAKVSGEDGLYAITNLPSDSFYVLTKSDKYVDELYENVLTPLGSLESWRAAQKVFVPAAIVNDINFDLLQGNMISGSILASDDTPVADGAIVDFTITSDRDSIALFTRQVIISEGRYQFSLPATGRFKVKAEVEGFLPTWAYQQKSWIDAQLLELSELSTEQNLDFKLLVGASGLAGQITGTVSPALFAITAAFDVKDTSFVRMGIAIGFMQVPYTLPDLPPGDYLVWADDYVGSLIGAGNSMGEFYDGNEGVRSVKFAKPVKVEAGLETKDINFALEAGTTVSGRVTDNAATPLDSLTLLLINEDLLDSSPEPFLSRFDLQIVETDFKGDYQIPGLKPGSYLLRTFSDYYVNFDLANMDSLLLDGKHKGKVIDQYLGGEPNLLRFSRAQRLVIQGEPELANINFNLAAANHIAGSVVDADGKPLQKCLIVALEDSSGFPFYPLGVIDSLGRYRLGPLPLGKYKVLAITGLSGDTDMLSEYYQDQRSFYTAQVIDLDRPLVDSINFILEKGAVIAGFVDLPGPEFNPIGADTLAGIPVVAYNSETGHVVSYDFVQFTGGFKIDRLLPGNYKVAAIPAASELGIAYAGGGRTFDAPLSAEVKLDYGDFSDQLVIELPAASGRLTGSVTDSASGLPLSGVFVGAYDQTGHLAGYALTDIDVFSGRRVSTDGTFKIHGLQEGAYYVRTVALFMAVNLLTEVTSFVDSFQNLDIMTLLFGGGLTGLSFDLNTFKDMWYPDVPATITISLDELLFQVSAYGRPHDADNAITPIFLPLPFYEAIPKNAQQVLITNNAETNVKFSLAEGDVSDLVTKVDESPTIESLDFVLNQNYPNPFNPATTLSFSLGKTEYVRITLYDILGKQIRILTEQTYLPGNHSLIWDGKNDRGEMSSAGVYIASVSAGTTRRSIRLLLMK